MSSILKAMLCASAGLGDPFWFVSCHAPADSDEPMGIIELDESLSDIEKPPELPAGTYTGEVQDVQIGQSQKGNRYFAVKFVIPADEIPKDIQEHFPDGAVLYWNRNIVPTKGDRRALFNLRKLIEALGLDSNTTSVDPNEWMGREARLRVTMGKWQGEDRAEIKSVEAAESRAASRRGAAKDEDEGRDSDKPSGRGGRGQTAGRGQARGRGAK